MDMARDDTVYADGSSSKGRAASMKAAAAW
jgi:hypothetical protein